MPTHRPRLIAALAALLAFLAAPLAAQAQPRSGSAERSVEAAPRASAASEAAVEEVRAKPALWVVKDKDTTIYLFGTIHILRPGISWLEGEVKRAFDASDELVLEIADQGDAAVQARVARQALDLGGTPLTERLPEDIRPRFTALLGDYQLPLAVINRMKPWFAAVTLTSAPLRKLGYDAALGVDNQLRKQAEAAGKRVIGLETTEEQLGFFNDLSEEVQLRMLVETINEQSDIDKTLNAMISSWSAGDPVALAHTINQGMEDDRELAEKLLFARNERWADWIKARLEQPGTVFLAVGAGHLAGKKSVQDALKARRIKASLVKR